MCFAPEDENEFFAALKSGKFNAKDVCRAVDANDATATEAADKTMILRELTATYGLDKYNA